MQGVLIIITKNHVAKMLCLSQIGITKPLTMCSKKSLNLCLHMALLSAFVQKGGWKVSQFKGNYANIFLMLIQAIWLKGTQRTYVNNKLMLLVAFDELQKPVNQSQVVFSNLHFRLQNLTTIIKQKKGISQQGDIIRWSLSA